jgi:hypothetical protein
VGFMPGMLRMISICKSIKVWPHIEESGTKLSRSSQWMQKSLWTEFNNIPIQSKHRRN